MFRSKHDERKGHYMGNGLRFIGDVRGSGDLVCDGKIEGMIELDGVVTIGPHGKMRGDIRAREVDIAGCVEGDVVTRGRVTLRASCTLKGDVTTEQLVVEPGAILQGQLQIERDHTESAFQPEDNSSTVFPK